jgi:5-methylcytosine-specific restriction enzyme subunit McrC
LPERIITFTEYSKKSIRDDLGWEISDPHLDLLERLNIASKDTLFTVGRRDIKASQYVGVVRLGDTTLQILPKISYSGDFNKPEHSPEYLDAVRSSMRNLLVMLSIACDLPRRVQDTAYLHTETGNWLEILTRLFALELHRQYKAGVPHEYIRIEDRLPVIKGQWLVSQQITRHSHDHLRFDVAYDEFSPDSPLNQIFALTVNILHRLTQDATNRRLLLDLHDWLSECNPHRERIPYYLSLIHFSRLNERFQPAYNLAKLFWQQQLVQLSSGDYSVFAFVFDMNILFQDFISKVMQRYAKRILPTSWQDGEILLQAQGFSEYLAERLEPAQISGQKVFPLYPDIIVKSSSVAPYLIADTKYKRLSPDKRDGGVSEGDAYQLLAYSRHWECPKLLLIYPSSNPYRGRFHFQIGGVNGIKIWCVELNMQQSFDKLDKLIEEIKVVLVNICVEDKNGA